MAMAAECYGRRRREKNAKMSVVSYCLAVRQVEVSNHSPALTENGFWFVCPCGLGIQRMAWHQKSQRQTDANA